MGGGMEGWSEGWSEEGRDGGMEGGREGECIVVEKGGGAEEDVAMHNHTNFRPLHSDRRSSRATLGLAVAVAVAVAVALRDQQLRRR